VSLPIFLIKSRFSSIKLESSFLGELLFKYLASIEFSFCLKACYKVPPIEKKKSSKFISDNKHFSPFIITSETNLKSMNYVYTYF